jgi:hypothetical protein
MAKVLVVTSGKGGVGKTTSTAALGAALAQAGQKVAVVDFDVGLRNLDLVLGAERRVVFDLINVVQGVAKLFAGFIRDKRLETLWHCRLRRLGTKMPLPKLVWQRSSRKCAANSIGSFATVRPGSSAAQPWRCGSPTPRW